MFASAKLKIDRANHHIRDTERQLQFLTEKNLHGITRQSDSENGVHIFTVEPSNPPTEIALTVGDAIHNLRCALDHLTWEAVGRDGGTQDRYLKFPTGDNRTSFESSCQGMKTPSIAIKNMFKALQAFPRGNGHFLYVLHRLDNLDKHSIITPVFRVSQIQKLVVRNRQGEILKVILHNDVQSLGEGESFTIDSFPEASFIDVNYDTEISPDILFGDVEFLAYQPILPTLAQLGHAVLNTIEIVERSVI